jgi:hypothetical protein
MAEMNFGRERDCTRSIRRSERWITFLLVDYADFSNSHRQWIMINNDEGLRQRIVPNDP